MPNYAAINPVDHQDTRIITTRSAEFGDNLMCVMTFPFEFRSVQANYPILFQQDSDGGYVPVALFGFQEGENLFLTDPGWDVHYVPVMVRREPFLVGTTEENGEVSRMLSLNMDHPRVNTVVGEALFDPAGRRTPFLEEMANLLESVYMGNQHAREFVAAMQAEGLIEPLGMEITLSDGSRNQLLGFSGLDEEKIQQLPASKLGELNEQGFLMPMFMVLASLGNVQALVDRKNRQLRTGDNDQLF